MARAAFSGTGAQSDASVVAAPGAGLAIKITKIMFTVSAASTVAITNGADAAGTRLIYGDFGENGGGIFEEPVPGRGWDVLSANTALLMTTSAGNIKGVVWYEVVSQN